MGFFRRQEENLAVRYLRWQYEKQRIPAPAEDELRGQAARIVADAHRIARERGGNLSGIMKQMVEDFFKKK
jgi:hypothetical protein